MTGALDGTVAIVTGAGRGIGSAIAERLAADGARTIVHDHSSGDAAEALTKRISEAGGEAHAVQAVLAKPDEIARLFAKAETAFGTVTSLVNKAAAHGNQTSAERLGWDEFRSLFAINVGGPMMCMVEFANRAGPNGGRIVNLTSGQARMPMPGAALYAGTKDAMEAPTRGFAADLGPRKITVNAVTPGATATDTFKSEVSQEVRDRTIASTALGRLGSPMTSPQSWLSCYRTRRAGSQVRSSTPMAGCGAEGAGGWSHDALDASLAGTTCKMLLQSWDASMDTLQRLADSLAAGHAAAEPVTNVRLLTPVLYPDNLLAVGANYFGHLKEMGLAAEKRASMPFFVRPPKATLVGPGDTVRIPRSTGQFDWECELAVVIGRRLRHADRAEAVAAVAGYAIGLDLSCRDLIRTDNDLKIDLVRGKAQDTMAPCGPEIVPARFVDGVDDLRVTLAVNGETMMDASTSEMLYKIDEQLSVISEYMTLMPGDILFTGSPSGSAGVHGDRWLKHSDRIRAEIAQIGVLEVGVHDDV